jgi:hypothetical protein
MAAEGTRYRFGPLERRGLVAGWRGGQIASVAGGLIVAVLVLRSRPTPASIVVALVTVVGGIAFACWPVGGRTGEEWLPTVARWESAKARGSRRHRSPAPGKGQLVGNDGVRCRTDQARRRPRLTRTGSGSGGPFGDLTVLSAQGAGRGANGVIVDRRARTYTAVLALRGHSFALLDPLDKERRVAAWSGVLASLARQGSAVHRVQWLATTVPDDGRAVRDHLAERAELGEDAAARRSYSLLLDGAGASTCRHEAHLAIQVSAGVNAAGRCGRSGAPTPGAAQQCSGRPMPFAACSARRTQWSRGSSAPVSSSSCCAAARSLERARRSTAARRLPAGTTTRLRLRCSDTPIRGPWPSTRSGRV